MKKTTTVITLFCLMSMLDCLAQEVPGRSSGDLYPGGPFSFYAIENLPFLRKGVQTKQFSAYDRAGDNYDWAYFPLYSEPDGECVIFDAFGPGCLWRHHMNLWYMDTWDKRENSLEGVRIRYYFDDESEPRIDMDVSIFFSEENPLGVFKKPFAWNGENYFRVVYLPMYFQRRLKVTLSREPGGTGTLEIHTDGEFPEQRVHWYQYTYHTFTEDPGIPSGIDTTGMEQIAAVWEVPGQDPKPPSPSQTVRGIVGIGPGENKTLFTEGTPARPAPGSLSSLRLTLHPINEETLFNTWLKICFDGAETPQVDAPLGMFFGAYRTELKLNRSLLSGFHEDSSMYCHFPMPWWESARITIHNRGAVAIDTLLFDISTCTMEERPYPRQACGHFYAKYNMEFPRMEGHDYTYLYFEGAGHIAGHYVARWETCMEENERTYFDHGLTPRIQGNGFEDDHNMGWGLKNISHPVFGAVGAEGGAGAAYRLYIPDLYVFHSRVKHGHQVYGPNSPLGFEGNYLIGSEESVTFFYAREKPSLVLSDELDIGDETSEKSHAYRVTGLEKNRKCAYWYDGEQNNVLYRVPAITDDGRSFNGSSEFTVTIDPSNEGVRLRRRIDKEAGRQLANVYVDGEKVTERPWYAVDFEQTYKLIRWMDTDFEIPSKYTAGKDRITLRIEYVPGQPSPAINEFRYWIFSYIFAL